MTDSHERWEDAAGSYVLGALTDEERTSYEAHLETCPSCRAEVDELRVAAEALPVSPPPLLPPPALKARIMAEVEREAALLASAGKPDRAAASAPERRKRRWLGGGIAFPRAALGALACVMLVIGLGLGAVVFSGGSGRTVPVESTIPTAKAELEVNGDTATLVANGLPLPPNGKTYMVWLSRPGHAPEPTSALFTPRRDGSATASVTGDLKDVDAVLVNIEPVGGSTTPTSDVLMTAKLS
ncbi:anti-sigma factor [Solirubrobacter ginsenosidimutans]|uniref:Regulator of SigK n=1 Tax=Solirubrobacter ginsenosidimutans TaxID=490573 RepID=A0A9X3S557_9ACTN|nr:anti-sigma factor [Solirubrobacter ginsenosidimutans]MDA0163831.1 anti-sigma factor [Solirubrobacter ginsenosidimutans]